MQSQLAVRCIGGRVFKQSDPHEWVGFAHDDLAAARLLLTDAELQARMACFHAQQAAEKASRPRWCRLGE